MSLDIFIAKEKKGNTHINPLVGSLSDIWSDVYVIML